jgi:hypothetical protein
MVINTVVREWLRQTLGVEVARQGLGDLAQTILVAFYADDSASHNPPSFLMEVKFYE